MRGCFRKKYLISSRNNSNNQKAAKSAPPPDIRIYPISAFAAAAGFLSSGNSPPRVYGAARPRHAAP
ncbi:MAG: hypothetical protein ABI687_05340 [Flavitalea sp.]